MTQEQYDLERMRAWRAIVEAIFSSPRPIGMAQTGNEQVKLIVQIADFVLKDFDSRFSPNQGKKEGG